MVSDTNYLSWYVVLLKENPKPQYEAEESSEYEYMEVRYYEKYQLDINHRHSEHIIEEHAKITYIP